MGMMRRFAGSPITVSVFGVLLMVVLVSCKNTESLRTEDKILICENVLLQLVRPQCNLIPDSDPGNVLAFTDPGKNFKYAEFCRDTIDIAAAACDAGFNKNPRQMCYEIDDASSGCELIPFEEGDDVNGPHLCKQALTIGTITCLTLVENNE